MFLSQRKLKTVELCPFWFIVYAYLSQKFLVSFSLCFKSWTHPLEVNLENLKPLPSACKELDSSTRRRRMTWTLRHGIQI